MNHEQLFKEQFRAYALRFSEVREKPIKPVRVITPAKRDTARVVAAPPVSRPQSNTGQYLTPLSSSETADTEEAVPDAPRVSRPREEVKLEIDGFIEIPHDYVIKRDAEIAITAPESSDADSEKYGYRDQEEVFRIIDKNIVSIEHCYQRAERKGMVKSGFVKLQFKITHDGYILPQSIRIIKSTLRNKYVEQCIKKAVRRIRGFEHLDARYGTALVTHKFVFN